MKSFFKKLAFVMALAMVVSLAAPAAQTAMAANEMKIAYQNGSAITEINLAEVGATEDLKFIGAPSNWKTLGFKWTSSNEAVATVDQNGIVTAVSAGTADIAITVGETTAVIKANVVNLPTYTATIGTADNRNMSTQTIKVGESFDFAFFGIKDYDQKRYFCTWAADDPTVLDVDQKGLATALKAGTSKVTLVVFNKLNGKIHAVAPVNVTVPGEEVEAPLSFTHKQLTQNTLQLTFTEEVDFNVEDITMQRVFEASVDTNNDGVIDERDIVDPYQDFFVEYFEQDKDEKNVYTVYPYADFVDGATYSVQVNGLEEYRFVASVGEVAKVVVEQATPAYLPEADLFAEPATLVAKLYDKNGVDVTTVVKNGVKNIDNVSFELVKEVENVDLIETELTFTEMATAVVVANYDYYNDATYSFETITSEELAVRPTQRGNYKVAEVVAWTIIDTTLANWAKAIDWDKTLNHTLPAGDNEGQWKIVALLKDSRDNYFTTSVEGATSFDGQKYNNETVYFDEELTENDSALSFGANGYYLEYVPMNPDRFLVDAEGTVESYEQTRGLVALYLYNANQYENPFVSELSVFPVEITKERVLTQLTIDANAFTGSVDTETVGTAEDAYYSVLTVKTFKLNLKDQYGKAWTGGNDNIANNFKVTTNNNALREIANALEAELNGHPFDSEIKFTLDANELKNALLDAGIKTVNSVKFTITETNSRKAVTVTANLSVPNYDGADVEVDALKNIIAVDAKVSQTIGKYSDVVTDVENDLAALHGNIMFYKTSKNFKVGFVNDLKIATEVPATVGGKLMLKAVNAVDETDVPYTLVAGDKVLVVTGPNGKLYPTLLSGEAKETTGATSSVLGVTVTTAKATNPDGTETPYSVYEVIVAGENADGRMSYAPTGRYSVRIYTVDRVDANGNAILQTNNSSIENRFWSGNIQVTNENAKVTMKHQPKRDLTEALDFYSVKELVVEAFDFKIGGNDWNVSASQISDVKFITRGDYLIVRAVKFMVPVDGNNATKAYYDAEVTGINLSVKIPEGWTPMETSY